MNLNFAEALATLGRDAAFRVSRAARAGAEYLFNTIIPDRDQFTYSVEGGDMTVTPTMPGLVGMDSPYPPMGNVSASTFLEQSAKIAGEVPMTERALRHLQEMLMRTGQVGGAATNERLIEEAFNFLDLVIIQPHMDIREWLKGQALQFGNIDWTFNNKNLLVSYGIPAGNFLPTRTVAAGDAYHLAGSAFWADVQAMRRALRGYGQVRFIAHPDTIDAIRFNPAHAGAVVAEDGNGGITFRRYANNDRAAFSADAADAVQLISYGLEGSILNPADPATTLSLPMINRGRIVAVGIGRRRQNYVVGAGGQSNDPNAAIALGYGHVAPTIEGNGQPGLWTDLFTPENQPWSLRGRGAQNFLPVIEDNKAIAGASTEMA